MSERAAMRLLWVATPLAATALVVAVRLFDAADEVLVFGTALIIIASSLAGGLVTGLDRRRDE